jgi:aromatic ring hydroxylase
MRVNFMTAGNSVLMRACCFIARSKSNDMPVMSRLVHNISGGRLGSTPSQRDLQNAELASG